MEARVLAGEVRVRFGKAVDASNRVVMTEDELTSAEFSRESRAETDSTEVELARLGDLLRGLDYASELQLLGAAQRAFSRYRTLDREILELAAENTNIKAQRLSFGPGHAAANALRDALSPIAKTDCPAHSLALRAIASVREIEALQAPHIAASQDDAMTLLERAIGAAETSARAALQELSKLGVSVAPAADAAFKRFLEIDRQIVSLSRRNSNVRSLELSLGEKRQLTAACEQNLSALVAALAERSFPATR
jgi:hypothetical protein